MRKVQKNIKAHVTLNHTKDGQPTFSVVDIDWSVNLQEKHSHLDKIYQTSGGSYGQEHLYFVVYCDYDDIEMWKKRLIDEALQRAEKVLSYYKDLEQKLKQMKKNEKKKS